MNLTLSETLKTGFLTTRPYYLSTHFRDEEDFGENAEVKYIVTGGNGSALFSVDQLSGRCSLVALTFFKNLF